MRCNNRASLQRYGAHNDTLCGESVRLEAVESDAMLDKITNNRLSSTLRQRLIQCRVAALIGVTFDAHSAKLWLGHHCVRDCVKDGI